MTQQYQTRSLCLNNFHKSSVPIIKNLYLETQPVYKYWFADVLNFAFNRSIVCTQRLYCVIHTSGMISYVTVLSAAH